MASETVSPPRDRADAIEDAIATIKAVSELAGWIDRARGIVDTASILCGAPAATDGVGAVLQEQLDLLGEWDGGRQFALGKLHEIALLAACTIENNLPAEARND